MCRRMTWQMAKAPQWTDEIHPKVVKEKENLSKKLWSKCFYIDSTVKHRWSEYQTIWFCGLICQWFENLPDIHIKVQQTWNQHQNSLRW